MSATASTVARVRDGAVALWAFVFWLGSLAGRWLGLPLPLLLSSTAIGIVCLLAGLLRSSPRYGRRPDAWIATPATLPLPAVVLTSLVLIGVAASAAAVRLHVMDVGPLAEMARRGGVFDVGAMVATEPRVTDRGWWAIHRVMEVDGKPTRERALVRGEGTPPALGSRWRGRATARPLGDDGFEGYLRSQHAAVRLDPRRWQADGPPNALFRSTEAIRERVRRSFGLRLDPSSAGLAVGLVTGDTRLLPAADEDAMRATGLTHLVAVSGSNVAIVAGGALLLGSWLRLGARGRRWLVGAVIAWFAVLTRFEPSVLRASVMAVLVLGAGARGVPVDAVRTLSLTVLLLLALDPFLGSSLGLVLSATATAGVLVFAPLVARRLHRVPRRLAQVLAVTIGAQLTVAPALLVTQGEVPLASVPANLVAVPAAALASTVAGVAAVVAQASPVVGSLVVQLADPPLRVILWLARRWQHELGVLSLAQPVAFLLALATGLWLLARPAGRVARRAAAVAVLAGVAIAVPVIGARAPVRTLTLTAIDVGQGDAVLVQSPGATMLVDAGEDAAAARWLRRHGVSELDLVVVSHPHADHVGGVPAVLRQSRVGTLWYRPVEDGSPAVDETLRLAASSGVSVHEPSTSQRAQVGDLLVEVLNPPTGRPFLTSESEPNDMSLVVRVNWGSRSVLLTGDVEEPAQREIMRRGFDVSASVLKVPHHGAVTTDPAFLAATRATVAVVSVGRDNRYGHPHPDTMAQLQALGMEIHRTDRDGTIRFEVPPTGGEIAATGSGPTPQIASLHAPRLPVRGTRGVARPSVGRSASRPPPCRRTRSRRRDRRRARDRAPPRAANRIPVRRVQGRGVARGRGPVRRPQARGRGLPRGTDI